MEQRYIDAAKVLKAISDPKRLRIVDMLSCGELCACVIQEEFNITQPTLSHDMRVLLDAGVVVARKEWKKTFYSLNAAFLEAFLGSLSDMFRPTPDCVCRQRRKPEGADDAPASAPLSASPDDPAENVQAVDTPLDG